MKTKLLPALFVLLIHTCLLAQVTPVTCDKITVDSVLNSTLNKNNIELIITNHDSTTAWSPENFTVLSMNGDSVGHIILCQGCVILMHNRTGKFYLPKNDTNFTIPANYCCQLILAASGHQVCHKQYSGCIVAGVPVHSKNKNAFSILPNPASNFFSVHTNIKDDNSLTFRILNLQGKEIRKDQKLQNEQPIDISDLVSGMYFIQLYKNGQLQGSEKLIIP